MILTYQFYITYNKQTINATTIISYGMQETLMQLLQLLLQL